MKPSANAKRLVRWLEREGLTYRDAGTRLGVSGETIRLWVAQLAVPRDELRQPIEWATDGRVPAKYWPEIRMGRPRG